MNIKMIFGPPGTGKTTYLLNTLEKLLKKYNPQEIAFVSFTKKGSYEGKERAIKKFNFKDKDTPYFRTLHSLAFNSLNLNRSDIIDKKDYKEFSTLMGMKFIGYYTEELKHNDDMYLFFNKLYRNNKKAANKLLNFLDMQKLKFVSNNYKRFKHKLRLLDFTDIIEMFIEKDMIIPVKVVIIDEAQDLTTLQWKMIFSAFRKCKEMYIAGDDDQSIYEWSGADINFFMNLKYTDFKILNKSYRLPNNVLAYSNKITNLIQHRINKEFKGNNKKGCIKYINNLKELNIDNEKSWMFLSRNNYFLKEIKDYFRNKGILFYYKNELSINKTDIEAIKQYNIVKKNKLKTLPSIVKLNLKKDFDLRLNWYDNFKWDIEKIIYCRDLIKNKVHLETNYNSNIFINTIHTVKGGEADNVVVLQDITKNVKLNLETNPDSEHRIFYVACTRTKQNLYIIQNKTKNFYNFL